MRKYNYFYKTFRIERETVLKLEKAKLKLSKKKNIKWDEFFNIFLKKRGGGA